MSVGVFGPFGRTERTGFAAQTMSVGVRVFGPFGWTKRDEPNDVRFFFGPFGRAKRAGFITQKWDGVLDHSDEPNGQDLWTIRTN